MGAAVLAFWPSVDSTVYHHRIYLRHGFLESMERGVAPRRRLAVSLESGIQFLFYLFPIWTQEQPPRIYRHPPRPYHPRLGIIRCVASY